jgi:hypothetical protein
MASGFLRRTTRVRQNIDDPASLTSHHRLQELAAILAAAIPRGRTTRWVTLGYRKIQADFSQTAPKAINETATQKMRQAAQRSKPRKTKGAIHVPLRRMSNRVS